MTLLGEAWLMARKDLRIEFAAKVIWGQVLPFGLIVLVLFGLALSPDLKVLGAQGRTLLAQAAPGLIWVTVLLSSLLATGRSFDIENDVFDALRVSGIDPAAIFIGKGSAVVLQLLVLQVALWAGGFLLYRIPLGHPAMLVTTMVLATCGIVAATTFNSLLSVGTGIAQTLLPLLSLPALAPVLLASTKATDIALFGSGESAWPWISLLAVCAMVNVGVGILSFSLIMENL